MDEFITIKTYPDHIRLMTERIYLETNGIQCKLKNEHIGLMNSKLASAIGGIELQVEAQEFERACNLMVAKGYLASHPNHHEEKNSGIVVWGANWPLLKSLRPEQRIIVIMAVIFSSILIGYYLLFVP
ncbi:MAG: hypothetical protein ACOYLH_01440 [Flavobacteriales bacterium]